MEESAVPTRIPLARALITNSSSLIMLSLNIAVAIVIGYWAASGTFANLISPSSYPIIAAIAVVAIVAISLSFRLMSQVVRDDFIERAREMIGGTSELAEVFAQSLATLKTFSVLLSTIGLIATIYGFMISLSMEQIAAVIGTNSSSAFQKLVVQLAEGTGIALQATFVASVAALIVVINVRLINRALALKWVRTFSD